MAQLLGYFGDGHRFGCNIAYAVQEPTTSRGASTSPGLAQALDAAYPLTRGRVVFFGMADTILEPQDVFARAWAASHEEDDVVLILFPTDRPQKFGMVDLDAAHRVREVVDKPASTHLTLMWGCMIWRERFTDRLHWAVRQEGISDFARILNDAIAAGMQVCGVPFPEGRFRDLGTYEEIAELDAQHRGP